jgi:hypothetical protein
MYRTLGCLFAVVGLLLALFMRAVWRSCLLEVLR